MLSENGALIPFLIDQLENIMCFIVYNPEKFEGFSNDQAQFKAYFQEALKVHDSVSNFIFDQNYESELFLNFQLVARYRQEFFNEKPYEDASRSNKYYAEMLSKLKLYDLTSFKNFFWTSNDTTNYFENVPEPKRSSSEFLIDYSRHRGWKDIHDNLQQMVSQQSDNQDICSFSNVMDFSELSEVSRRVYISSQS